MITTASMATALLQVLDGLGDSSAFCAAGNAAAVLPGLHVDGVGDVGVPVSATDAKRLIKQAAQAPYGRGEKTIIDPTVRRVWQLEPAQFELRNTEWTTTCLAPIVDAVRQEFGIAQKVEAQLYKLLVYEEGSFFAPHRDSEKAERMFATLVVCLPSKHQGGTLVVSHDGRTRRIDFDSAAAQFQIQYAAFYADCQHEITPVASGYRVCLVYNLSIAKSKRQPSAPVNSGAIDSAAQLLTKIFADKSREKIAIPLKHQYTEAGLGAEDNDAHPDTGMQRALRLKGGDQARMDTLARAAEKAGCQAFLALLTHWQSGSVDYSSIDDAPYRSRGWRYRDDDDDDDGTSGENAGAEFEDVIDESMSLSHWFDATGRVQPFSKLALTEAEIVSDVAPEDRPYRQEISEATGNEGVSMERWYRQAAIVIWPQDRYFRILAGAGPLNAVPALDEWVHRTAQPARDAQCCAFAREIISRWQQQAGSAVDTWDARSRIGKRNDEALTTRMLRVLQTIDDEKSSVAFVRDILPAQCDGSEGLALTRLVDQHGWRKCTEPLRQLFAKQVPSNYGRALMIPVALFEALCCGAPKMTQERLSVCRLIVDELEAVIERWDRRKWDAWQSEPDHRIGIVAPVFRALIAIEATDALDRFASRATADPTHYDLHAVLLPAAKTLLSDGAFPGGDVSSCGRTGCERLRQHCLAELRARTAQKPQPPTDWRRDAKLDCKCADCRELAAFLDSKHESVHRFPRRKDLRQHLHQQIDKHRRDVTHVTEHRGSPHTLVCTKTQAGYARRMKQFATDLRWLGELERLPIAPPVRNRATKARH
ncbi:MAG: 2OG-Fe(II) oxygenase [Burkholderiales bacterium]